jgi:DNA repair protein RadD
VLRDYQAQNIEDIETRLDRGKHVLFTLPTGGGKTVVATAIIERAVERGERVLMLTHRREIPKQTSLKLLIEHGLIQAGLNMDLTYPVQIASIQTLHARAMRSDKIPLPAADLIIIDEAHHVRAQTWAGILEEYPNARRLGLTATPCRSNGRGLGNIFTTIVEGPQVAALIEQKHLVPTVYYAPVDPDLKGVYASALASSGRSPRRPLSISVNEVVSCHRRPSRKSCTFCFWASSPSPEAPCLSVLTR